jgi:chromosome segregation ATPase
VNGSQVDLDRIENSYEPTNLLYKDVTSLIAECRRLRNDNESYRNQTERYQKANEDWLQSNRTMNKRIETLTRELKEENENRLKQRHEYKAQIDSLEDSVKYLRDKLEEYERGGNFRLTTLTSDELFYIEQALEFRLTAAKHEVDRYPIDSSDCRRCNFIIEICERSLAKVHNLLELANSTKHKAVTLKG